MSDDSSHGSEQLVHATCVAFDGIDGWSAPVPPAALLRGPSGIGKSDLALRLIAGAPAVPGWPVGAARLVADDQVSIRRDGDRLLARAPLDLAELMEVRACGPVRLPVAAVVEAAEIVVIVDLAAADRPLDRLPARETRSLFGVTLPRWRLTAWEMSAPEKLRLAIGLATGAITDAGQPRPGDRLPKDPRPRTRVLQETSQRDGGA